MALLRGALHIEEYSGVLFSPSYDRLLCGLCTVYHHTVLALDSDCIANELSAR